MIQHLALFVHDTHGIGRDLVNNHHLAVNQTGFDLHIDQGKALFVQVGLYDATHAAGDVLGLLKLGRAGKTEGNDGVVVNEGVAAFIILDGDLNKVIQFAFGIPDVLLVTAHEAAPGTGAANELKPAFTTDILAQRFGTTHFHGALFKIKLHEMGGDVGGVKAPEEVVSHGEGFTALAFNLADNGVGTRVNDAVLAGNVIFEDKEDIAARQGVQVFGFAGINFFVGIHLYMTR